MTEKLDLAEVAAVQNAIDGFLAEKLESKLKDLQKEYSAELKKLTENDIGKRNALELELQEKTIELQAKFERKTWVANAAVRAAQLSLATHALKFTHPDAKGTNIFMLPSKESPSDVVATPADPREDVVGNAAALDVYKFLSIEASGRSLLRRAFENDSAFLAALGADNEAQACLESFRKMAESSALSSHTLAKQVYWPLTDGGYHLLAPLFPSSLIQQAYDSIQEDRFGEQAKASREARSKGLRCAQGFRDYPGLLAQHYGGTKPQNISQLNSNRHGENWLLCSCPPQWQSTSLRLPLYAETVFGRPLIQRRFIREQRDILVKFLEKAGDYTNKAIRETREDIVATIFNNILSWAELLRAKPGWSRDPNCRLHEAELCWLDPVRAEEDALPLWQDGSWKEAVSRRLANWFNDELTTPDLPMAEEEYEIWKKDFKEMLNYE